MIMSLFWKLLGILIERADQALLTLEYARFASEDIVLEAALVDLGLAHHPLVLEAIVDAGELQDRGEIRRQVAAEHAQAAGRLVGFLDGIDHLAVGAFGAEALDLPCEGFARTGQDIAVQQPGFQQLAHDHLHAADLVDVDHGVLAVGPRIGEDRHDMLREVIELLRRHDLLPEIGVAGGARDLGGMQHHIGRAADGHRDDHRVADGIAHDDVARLQVLLHELGEKIDQFGRELVHPAGVVGGRRHHVQRLHADDADERLHGVIGEHAAAAAVAGAGVTGDVVAILGIGVSCDLIGAYEVDLLARLRIGAGMDRAVRHDDRRMVVLEQRRQRTHRRLVAGNDRDRAGKARRAQVLAKRIVGHLAADQRVAHLARAIADPV